MLSGGVSCTGQAQASLGKHRPAAVPTAGFPDQAADTDTSESKVEEVPHQQTPKPKGKADKQWQKEQEKAERELRKQAEARERQCKKEAKDKEKKAKEDKRANPNTKEEEDK